ncbi:MAG: ABC transporter ATP-binding protein [Chloroflexi bacterium]|nr:ABC transporter ATP-binding protein [Chloroflexota bacterium]
MTTQPLLDIRDLYLDIKTFDGTSHVLNGVNLTLRRGVVMGLVGETGCGKTLTGLSISRLVATPPGNYPRGEIWFDGQNVMRLPESEMRKLRGRRIAMIFQDPATNLNPVFKISEQMIDVALHIVEQSGDTSLLGKYASAGGRRQAARTRAIELLEHVGIEDAARRIDGYPHEFSGGMRQRVLIAMALLGQPQLLIADEPTTALDVSVQAQILRLFYGLVKEFHLSVLLITHNLGVVAQLCDEVAVMYAGNIVESGTARRVFKHPSHPYTQGLLRSIPTPQTMRGELLGVPGNIPNLIHPPPGCRFEPRCPHAMPVCRTAFPATTSLETAHQVACYLYPKK